MVNEIDHNNHAYIDTDIVKTSKHETWIRTFSKDVDPKLLVWHVDGNRTIEVLETDGNWAVQFTGDDPVILEVGMILDSPEDTLHRAIKNNPTKDLVIKITEYYI